MSKGKRRYRFCIWYIILIALLCCANGGLADQDASPNFVGKLQSFVQLQFNASEVPGMAVAVVSKDNILFSSTLGSLTKMPDVSPDQVLFELGSNSKAYTAVAILQLAREKKLNLNDKISRYIPDLKLYFAGKPVDPLLRHFLYHTSGVPESSLSEIPSAVGPDALAKVVEKFAGQELKFLPGSEFEYASMNYNILGRVIEVVSEKPFADYVKNDILRPLQLSNTFIGRYSLGDQDTKRIATGHFPRFTKVIEYEASRFDGNTPSAYFLATLKDASRWLQLNLGYRPDNPIYSAIEWSHIPDRTVKPAGDGSSYAAGWEVHQGAPTVLQHSGTNPNFSSFMAVIPQEDLGIVVLTNINSANTRIIGANILKFLHGKETRDLVKEPLLKLSAMMTVACLVGISAIALLSYLIWRSIRELIINKDMQTVNNVSFRGLITASLAGANILFALYLLPVLLFQNYPWNFIFAWGPQDIQPTLAVLVIAVVFFVAYKGLRALFFAGLDEHPAYIAIVSIFTGLCNVYLLFLFNQAIIAGNAQLNSLSLYFVVIAVIYTTSQMFLRIELSRYGHGIVFHKRRSLVNFLLKRRLSEFETLRKRGIEATISGDTEKIGDTLNALVSFSTCVATIFWGLIYLSFINYEALLLFVVSTTVLIGCYLFVNTKATRQYELARDCQDHFFKLLFDLINGFKELKLSNNKRIAFEQDLVRVCQSYRDSRIMTDYAFSALFVLGEMLFMTTIAAIIFIYPRFIFGFRKDEMQSYVLIVIFLTGPINEVLRTAKVITQLHISWSRIQRFLANTDPTNELRECIPESQAVDRLELVDVQFRYEGGSGECDFALGPINATLRRGQVTFITGGNGSGKTTLAKIIVGLYEPTKGSLRTDAGEISAAMLQHYFGVVFNDSYLFQKLYGIDVGTKRDLIEYYLRRLKLDAVVSLAGESFATLDLSKGQKTRLALIVTLVEGNNFLFFDELAADQDPDFRRFFYEEFIAELKAQDKCVILVSHDDRYFGVADQIIDLNFGKQSITSHRLDEASSGANAHE